MQVSCVGGFGSNSHMYKINGSANINAIRAAAEQGSYLVKCLGYLTKFFMITSDFVFLELVP